MNVTMALNHEAVIQRPGSVSTCPVDCHPLLSALPSFFSVFGHFATDSCVNAAFLFLYVTRIFLR